MPLVCFGTSGFVGVATSSVDNAGSNTDNEISTTPVSGFISGRVTKIHSYFAGHLATVTARCAAWRVSDGAIAAKSAQFTAAQGSGGVNGQFLNEKESDGSQLLLGNNDTLWVGFWRLATGAAEWGVAGTGSFQFKTDTSGDIGVFSGNSNCGTPFICGNPQAYVDVVGGDVKSMTRNYVAMQRRKR